MQTVRDWIQKCEGWAWALGGIGVCFLALSVFGVRWAYPYGLRPCCLPSVMMALQSYARDHGGIYPDASGDAFAALGLLYPTYESNPAVLAGISGDRDEVSRRLRSGQRIEAAISSWVYWPGLDDADPSLAIIWERAEGVRYDGRRASGHAVGFADGTFRQVAADHWDSFLQIQEAIRRERNARNR